MVALKLKRPIARRALARELKVSVETLRHHEENGTFKPIKKTDEAGRPLVMYSKAEARKASEFYHERNVEYITTDAQLK